jgi:hypothetical protein
MQKDGGKLMAQFAYSAQATSESTFIYEASPTTNYGTNAELSLGRSAAGQIRRSLIRFPALPLGVTAVANGKLYLYSSSELLGVARDVNVYRCIRNWVENQATWNVYSTGNNWGTSGADNATDYQSSSLGSATVSATIAANAEVQISLNDALLLAYLQALTTYQGGFELRMYEAGTDSWNPHSNDAVTSTYRPKLTFDYWLGKGVRSTFVGA